jgi:hypothetical protein
VYVQKYNYSESYGTQETSYQDEEAGGKRQICEPRQAA